MYKNNLSNCLFSWLLLLLSISIYNDYNPSICIPGLMEVKRRQERLVFVDPEDEDIPYWWPAIVTIKWIIVKVIIKNKQTNYVIGGSRGGIWAIQGDNG